MGVGFQIWLGSAGVVSMVWLLRLSFVATFLRRRELLSERSYPSDLPPNNKVSIMVAANNEEDNIEACISGLLAQDYPDFEIIVVDDRSQDRTPQVLHRLAEHAGGRLRVIRVDSLREGWFGKTNAMREGVTAARGDWLCFTDADCRGFASRTLTVAMQDAVSHKVDFLSITPVIETHSWWERIIQPVCTLILMKRFPPFLINDPRRQTAYANGAFMLIRRSCYEAIGGHDAVRTEFNEDIYLAQLAKSRGFRLRVVENDNLYRTRMYRTFAEARRGWSRILCGSLGSAPRLVTNAGLVAILAIAPWISLLIAAYGLLAARADDGSRWMPAVGAWLFAVVLLQLVMWRVYPVLHVARRWSLAYVVGAVFAMGVLFNATAKTLGVSSTTWRGTTYRGRRVESSYPMSACAGEPGAPSNKEPVTNA